MTKEHWPSVTRVLPTPKFYCTPSQLKEAIKDGKERHAELEIFLKTGKTYGIPRIEKMKKFFDSHKELLGDLVINEVRLKSKKHRFTGKPDAVFTKAVLDLKRTVSEKKRIALQLAGYHVLAVENKLIKKTKRHLVLYETKKEFRAVNVYEDQAESVFLDLVKKYYMEQKYIKFIGGIA